MNTVINFFKYILITIILFNSNNKLYADDLSNKKTAKVLLLHSYHNGYLWTDEITRGVKNSIQDNIYDLHIEYMDTKRQFDEPYKNVLSDLLRLKQNKHHYDLIITSDNNAFDFIKKVRKEIYGDISVVFCGVNYLQKEDLEGVSNITGVNEVADIQGNLSLIEQLHPHCNKILIISDNSVTGDREHVAINKIIQNRGAKIPEVELLYKVSSEELVDTLRNLDSNTIVLLTSFFHDKNKNFLEYDKSAKLVCTNSVVPVYGAYNFSMGYGIVGGYLTNGYDQGFAAGKLALEILSGKPADDVPVIHSPSTRLWFDYRQLQRFGISIENLPVDSKILYRPLTFVQKHKKLIRNVSIVFSLLLLFILGLIYALRRSQKIKRELTLSQKKLSTLISNIPGVAYRSKADEYWSLIFISDYIEKISGYAQRDFLSNVRDFTSIVHKDDIEYANKTIKESINNSIPWEITYRIIHKNGSIRWLSETGRGIEDEKGEVEFLDGLILDITERKIAEDKLRKSEQNFKNIFDNSLIGIYQTTSDGRILAANPALLKMLGYSSIEELTQRNLEDEESYYEHSYSRSEFKRQIEKDGLIIGLECAWKRKDGSTLFVRENSQIVKNEDSNVIIYEGTVEDITIQKKAKEEILAANEELRIISSALKVSNQELKIALEEAKRSKELEIANEKLKQNEKILIEAHTSLKQKQIQLEKLNFELKESHEETQQLNEELSATNELLYSQKEELKSTLEQLKEAQFNLVQSEKMASVGILTAGIAHEINNPLNFIHGGKLALEGYIKNNLKNHINELKPLLEIIETGINRTTEIVKGLNRFDRKSEKYTERCDIHSIINNCLVILQNKLKHKIIVTKDYCTEEPIIVGNEGKLHQVFLNILLNAEQAIDKFGTITISSKVSKGKIKISINDTGCGIHEENLTKITDPFFTTKDPGKGTGLGLSIAYQIIKEHKGALKYISELGVGTTAILVFSLNNK